MRRLLLLGPLLLALAGCMVQPETSRASEVEQAAHNRAQQAYERLIPPPNYTAQALAQLLAERDLEIMSIEGDRSGTEPGVTIVVRIWQQIQGAGGRAVPLPYCYRMQFGEIHENHPVDRVDCPTTTPLDIPEIVPAPRLPDEQAVRAALSGVAVDPAAVRTAITTLDLPDPITVDIQSRDGAVGVGLRSHNSIGERGGCLLIRLDTASLEVWTLSGTADQPGESSCDGFGALARDGQRSPH